MVLREQELTFYPSIPTCNSSVSRNVALDVTYPKCGVRVCLLLVDCYGGCRNTEPVPYVSQTESAPSRSIRARGNLEANETDL